MHPKVFENGIENFNEKLLIEEALNTNIVYLQLF